MEIKKYVQFINEDIDYKEDWDEQEDEEYPFYLGYDHRKILDKYINVDDVISCFIYKPELKINDNGEETLDWKMLILSKDLYFEKHPGGVKVYSNINPGDHYINESSLIVIGKEGHMFEGEPYRGVILRED